MLYIFTTLIFLLPIVFYLYKEKKMQSPASFVICLYVISFLSSLFVSHGSEWYAFESAAYLGFILLIFFVPILLNAPNKYEYLIINNYSAILPVSFICSFLGIISLIVTFTNNQNIIENLMNPTAYRSLRYSGNVSFEFGIWDYISLIGLNLYYIQLTLFFLITCIHPEKKLLRSVLLLSSLAYPLNGLVIDMSRGALLLWLLMAALIYISMNRYIDPVSRSRINRWMLSCMLFVLAIFILVSVGRGQAGGELSTYFVNYFSHQFGNFSRFYSVASQQPNDLGYIFQILGYERLSLMDDANEFLRKYGFSLNVFATFVGDFIIHFTPIYIFFMAISFGVLFTIMLNIKSRSFGTLLIVMLISEVFIWGLFYYNHQWRISTFVFILVFFLRYLFNIDKGSPVILKPYLKLDPVQQ